MSQPFRLAAGGHLDRSRALAFEFDGERYEGYAGDTLASALLANGVHLVGRSFKYHRPRGVLAAGVEEPNALVTVRRSADREDPNTRATTLPLYEGLVAVSQNRWPSLHFDTGALHDRLSPLLPAGFYYKTFLRPASAWKRLYEPAIRRRAGLGVAPSRPDPDRYAQRFAHCELLVVGAGPAGLAAAHAASASGQRVILCDEQEELGSTLLYAPDERIEGRTPLEWRRTILADLASRPGVRLLPRTTAFGHYAQNFVGLAERLSDHLPHETAGSPLAGARERLWQVRAERVLLATGAIERPLVFADNDRPGILLAGAALRYVRQYSVLPGRCVIACVADESGYVTARACHEAGARVTIADVRSGASPAAKAAEAGGIEVLYRHVPTGTRGRRHVRALRLHAMRSDGSLQSEGVWKQCDLVLLAGGWTPAVHLHSQSRGTLSWSEEAQAFLPNPDSPGVESAGACRAIAGLDACAHDGRGAALRSADRAAIATAGAIRVLPAAGDRDAQKAFVDFQNDVTARDIRLAIREGFASVEHIKRYTTLGMATDQGRTSNLNGLAIAAEALERGIPQMGLTTFRAPYTPVTFGVLVGQQRGAGFDPVRLTPLHERLAGLGAVFEDVGQWKRAHYVPRNGEDVHAAVARECRGTRATVGIFDASTLGKIEVVGAGAAEFMNRMYVNDWTRLAPGRCRYGVMLREDGFILDDGVVGRLAPDRFHVTTTTSGAASVLHHMEDYLQTEFRDLEVWLTSTTEQWAVISLQGPKAREVLEPLTEGIDLSAAAFPHLAVRIGSVCGVPARVFRVSFTGELGFEVNVPASRGADVWDRLHARVTALDGVAYGTETMHVLRAEKGYIIVGQETDGTVSLEDVGLEWLVGRNKGDFVGKRSLQRAGMRGAGRKQLVGLLTCDERTVLEEGAQLMREARGGARPEGHVTSSYSSDAVGRPIALAMLKDGRARVGETIHATGARGGVIAAEVVQPVFVDIEGTRLAV